MRKSLMAAAAFVALAGVAGLALAQQDQAPARHGFDVMAADANRDNVVTRAEFDTWHDSQFSTRDANNDGQLSREEGRMGRHGGWRERGGRGMRHLASADANNDGAVTREEYLARPNQRFDRLDADHNGVISTAERQAIHDRRGSEHRGGDGHHGDGHRGDRPNADTNNDRQISRQEFSAMGASMFDRIDANHDARVTRDEAEAARPPWARP